LPAVFIYEALLIPFEITALSTVLNFWSDDIPPWAIPLACIVSLNKILLLATATDMTSRFFTGKQYRKVPREAAIPLCASQHIDTASVKLPLHPVLLLTCLSSILNVLAIKVFGEAEFWLSGGKVISPDTSCSLHVADFPRSSSS
jgi:amino acid permease